MMCRAQSLPYRSQKQVGRECNAEQYALTQNSNEATANQSTKDEEDQKRDTGVCMSCI